MDCEAFRDDLLDVLYGEADPATARRFGEHQGQCASCRDELSSLRRVRRDLDGWALAPRVPRRLPALRPWWLAAAAAALLAVAGGALVLARVEIRYPNGQTAWRVAAPGGDLSELRQLLQEQDERHARELAAVKAAAAQPAAAAAFDREALLTDVRRIVRESEGRQAALLTSSLVSVEERSEAQRRVDLAQMGAGLSYLEGKAGLQAARTTELMGHVLLASQAQGKR